MREETTFAVATLGCKVNQADSETISEQMRAAGFVQREFNEAADIYIVNTCTVTHLGDRSSRLMISQARRRQPEALLVVTGCYAERNPQAWPLYLALTWSSATSKKTRWWRRSRLISKRIRLMRRP